MMLETQFGAEPQTLNGHLSEASGLRTPNLDYTEERFDVQGHAKQLCVNKLGHTMVPPPEEGTGSTKFRQLFYRHRLKTVTYCAVFWSFGMCVAFLGPTLLDLECRISSVFSTMSWIFFSQSLFTLLGSASGGFLVQRLGSHPVLLVSTTMLSVTLATIPSCSVLGMLVAVIAVMGFFMGTIDTVANISMIQLYGRNVAPFLQALHFFNGLGTFLSPIIAEPFLLNKDCTQLIVNSTKAIHRMDFSGNLSRPLDEIEEAQHHSHIQYAFWILSGMQTPVIALLIIVVIRDIFGWSKDDTEGVVEAPIIITNGGENLEMSYQNGEGIGGIVPPKVDPDDRPNITRDQYILVTIFTASMLFLYDGLQGGFGGYISSYAVKSIAGMSMNEAAYLNACFWGTFAFGRLLSIGISTRLAPAFMLICNIIGCLTAMILMLSFRHNHSVLYIGTSFFGIFLSSIYPTTVTLAETYIPVTTNIATILVASAALGEMIVPVFIGHVFTSAGPQSVLITGVVMTIVSLVIYVALYLVSQTIIRQSSEQNLFTRLMQIIRPPKDESNLEEDSGLMKHHVKFYKRMKSELSETALGDLSSAQYVGDPNSKKEPANL